MFLLNLKLRYCFFQIKVFFIDRTFATIHLRGHFHFARMSPGARIRMLRIILGVSREDFCAKHEINLNTLISIELDRLKISAKQMNKIISAFDKEGLHVEALWIMEAKGAAPTRLLNEVDPQGSTFLENWASFFKNNRNAVITHVKNDAMEPFYESGDWVGGVWHTAPHLLLGRRCIVLHEGQFHLGTLYYHRDTFSLTPANPQVHYVYTSFSPQSARIAEVLWHIRKHSHQIPELATLDIASHS